jgi:hypothetical protein
MKTNPKWKISEPVAPGGNTLFHVACEMGKLKVAAFVLKLGKEQNVDVETLMNEEEKCAYEMTSDDNILEIDRLSKLEESKTN